MTCYMWMSIFWAACVNKGWVLPLAKAKQYGDDLMNTAFDFSVGNRIVNSNFDLTINVIWSLIIGIYPGTNRFENIWHLMWTACLYVTQERWWKFVLGIHGSSEGCTWIHSFLEGCVWNRFEHLWLKYFVFNIWCKIHVYM